MREFKVSIAEQTLERIRRRVAEFDWSIPSGGDENDWSLGTPAGFLKKLQAHWLERYDWQGLEKRLNRFPQFRADVDGLDMHFIHVKGSGPNPMPLLLIHGWPGSTIEFDELVEPLAHPEKFGADPTVSFDVVVASLPGYGFSGKLPAPIGPRRTGAYMNGLMTKALGYDRYFTQGGDWGCLVAGWMGFDHGASCKALHINMVGLTAGGETPGTMGSMAAMPETPEEIAWATDTAARLGAEGGYIAMQSTRPRTLGYALGDSPMGVAAWIVEKFHAWGDLDGKPLEQVFGMDLLLDNIMIYLVTGSFESSTWMYYGAGQEGVALPAGKRIEVPVAVASFPKDIIRNAPRSYVDKGYNIARWTDFSRGGHFAALEAPDMLLQDVRSFFASQRHLI